jgi:hypothetical protein
VLKCIAVLILVMSIGLSAQGRDPVSGAWELVANSSAAQGLPTPPLHLIYSNGHYVQFTAAAKRAKHQKPRNEMTREELLERYQVQGQYGTYRIEGKKLIRKSISAANPNNEGLEATSDFRVDADTLIVTSQNAQGQTQEVRFKRLQ